MAKKVSKKKVGLKKVKASAPPKKGVRKSSLKKGVVTSKLKKGKAKKTVTLPSGVDFAEGSDMAVAWEEVQKGGGSRVEVTRRLAERFKDTTTKNGHPKPVSTIVNHVLRRAKAAGYAIEESWKVVPTDAVEEVDTAPKKSIGKKASKKSAKLAKKKASKKNALKGAKKPSKKASKKASKKPGRK